MTQAGRFTKGVLQGMADRVAAVRSELSELTQNPAGWARVAEKALRKDLLVLETRLADAMAVAS